jgi:putative membrane protein
MVMVAKILAGVVMLIHVYIFLLETVMFRTRGRKVFGMNDAQVEMMASAMSNQGCYNGFLAAALAVGFLYPDPATAKAFTVFGLVCVAVAGIWGAATVKKSILYVQTVPAALALAALFAA